MFDSLENRVLFASGSLAPIVINGTTANDSIVLTQSGSVLTVNLNGVVKNYALQVQTPGSSINSPGQVSYVHKIFVNGLAGNDTISANHTVKKVMEIKGGAGNDWIRGGYQADIIYGGAGLTSGATEAGLDTIDGGQGNDKLYASRNNWCSLYGNTGDDLIIGYNGQDTLEGGSGNDSLEGGNGNDVMRGDAGRDTLVGNDGANQISGGTEDDLLVGGKDAEKFWGLNGDDIMIGNGGADEFQGNLGRDTVSYKSRTDNLVVTLDDVANDGRANEKDNVHGDVEVIICGSGDDKVTGNQYAQKFVGNGGADTFRGGAGDDEMYGGWGKDVLYGEAGNDDLFGEFSEDRLYGGDGNDWLDGGTDEDVLVAIGGGVLDTLVGGAGDYLDSFWLDKQSSETHDATQTEIDKRCVHRVNVFANGASKELNGQDIMDPVVADNDETMYWAGQTELSGKPLYGPTNQPSRNDVNQGALGDCWFLATLSSIADQDKNIIKQSVVDLGDGTYGVMFYEDGARRYYRVDNDLPVSKESYNIAYAQLGAGGAMWSAIMEKAYAIHEGGFDYDGIAGGWAEDAFDDMGISNTEIDVDDDNAMNTIKAHLAAGRAVTISSNWGSFETGDSYVASHVYSVISVNNDGTITLRNPWGSDAGNAAGSWMQGANDGYVTFTQSSVIEESDCFTVGYI